ncbi:hypothetical protein TSAR_001287 [Trichomalopsis sarcophagae]|uniref:Uncharacterized protein n=1 Tax=Trichomalopsis sarcophagae TaxID=543379 RepID=A0A232FC15_9HYME|nr:hypothetical protein TSAR_001287 [Trichomalopsis sarcophagae]
MDVAALHKDFSLHWIIAPTCNTKFLKKDFLRQNNWLALYHHGIDWYNGDVILSFNENWQDICKKVGFDGVMFVYKVVILMFVALSKIIDHRIKYLLRVKDPINIIVK